jgi:hypothetical protein
MDIFECVPYQVSYDLKFTYVDNVRTIEIMSEDFVQPVPWPLFARNQSLSATYAQTNYWAYQAPADLVGRHFDGRMWLDQRGGSTGEALRPRR